LSVLMIKAFVIDNAPDLTPSPIPTTPAPAVTETITPTVTRESVLLESVILLEPENGSCLDYGSEVTLRWSCPYALEAKEYYRLRLQPKGQDVSHVYYTKENFFDPPILSSGIYSWAAAVVRYLGQDNYEPVSEESGSYSFQIAPPEPVVHIISPTNTVKGTPAPVVVSGENFTQSITLTIGIPLLPTIVNSSTIETNVPMTLEVGEYQVDVKGSCGKGESSASFTVQEPTPTPKPVPAPWNPQTPVPTAPPGYTPGVACVVTPCAPAPQLIAPDDGAELTLNSKVEFKWTWIYCLPPGWKFAIRLSSDTPPHSWQYVDAPCEGGTSSGYYQIGISPDAPESRITAPGIYYWNIAVTRSLGDDKWERLSQNSEVRSFIVVTPPPPPPPPDCPVPPCP
jgi:hypothetical protein